MNTRSVPDINRARTILQQEILRLCDNNQGILHAERHTVDVSTGWLVRSDGRVLAFGDDHRLVEGGIPLDPPDGSPARFLCALDDLKLSDLVLLIEDNTPLRLEQKKKYTDVQKLIQNHESWRKEGFTSTKPPFLQNIELSPH